MYSINAGTGELTLVQSINSSCPGLGNAIDSAGQFYYCIAADGIDGYQISSSSGEITALTGSPFASTILFNGIATNPKGPYLYAAAQSSSGGVFHGYNINTSTGALAQMTGSPFALPATQGTAADFVNATVDPQGNYVFAVDGTNGVASYAADLANGSLTLNSSSFQSPGAENVAAVQQATSSSPNLVSLSITPTDVSVVTITLNQQTQFTLAGTYSDGSIHFLTSSASWTSSVNSVATVSSGLVTEVGYGTSIITATIGSLSASTSITLSKPALSSITVTPASINVHQGATVAFTAEAQYANGSTAQITKSATWSSSQQSVASVDNTGLATAATAGSSTITATYQGISDSANLTVVAPIQPASEFVHRVYTMAYPTGTPVTQSEIYGFSFDGATGSLTPLAWSPYTSNYVISGLQAHPSGNFLYGVVDSTGSNALVGFTIDSVTGGLTLTAGSPFVAGRGYGTATITPSGSYLYYISEYATLYGFSIDPETGVLSPISQAPFHPKHNLYYIAALGNYLYGGSAYGTVVYTINQSTGALTQIQLDSNCDGQNYTLAQNGHVLYCQSVSDVYAYQVDPATGIITLLNTFKYPANVEFGSFTLDPTGSYLYTTNVSGDSSYDDSIYRYSVDPVSGALTSMRGSPFVPPLLTSFKPEPSFFEIAFDPADKYLFVTAVDGGLGDYPFDSQDGQLADSLHSVAGAFDGASVLVSSSQPWAPDLTWSTPAPITYGTALGNIQLDATAVVAGAFTYTPPAGTILQAGQQELNVTFAPNDSIDYSSASASVTLEVNKATLTVTANNASRAYDTANPILTDTITGFVNGDTQSVVSGAASMTTTAVTSSDAGTYPITAAPGTLSAANYTFNFVNGILTITQAEQTITFPTLPTLTYGEAPFTLSATASSGLPVSFTSTTPSICTVSGTTVTLVGAQSDCTIQTTQAGNNDYLAAPAVTQSSYVKRGTQVITFATIPSQPYGAELALSATASSGLPVSFASTTSPVCTVSGTTATMVSIGTCTIQATQAGNSDYLAAGTVTRSFKVTQAPQTITFGALPTLTYGVAPFAVSANASSGLTVSFASTTPSICTVSGTTVTVVGGQNNCTIKATQAGNIDYLAAPAVTQSSFVNRKAQSITFAAIPSQADGATLPLSATASSDLAVSFASTTTSICTVSGSTATMIAVGTCTIQAMQAGNNDYLAAGTATRSFKVLASQTISFTALPTLTYGETGVTLSATASSGLPVTFASTTASICTVSGTTVTVVGAQNNCTIQATQAGNSVYAAATPVSQTSYVKRAPQMITFPAIPAQTAGTPLTLSASSSSGLPVNLHPQPHRFARFRVRPRRCFLSEAAPSRPHRRATATIWQPRRPRAALR